MIEQTFHKLMELAACRCSEAAPIWRKLCSLPNFLRELVLAFVCSRSWLGRLRWFSQKAERSLLCESKDSLTGALPLLSCSLFGGVPIQLVVFSPFPPGCFCLLQDEDGDQEEPAAPAGEAPDALPALRGQTGDLQ